MHFYSQVSIMHIDRTFSSQLLMGYGLNDPALCVYVKKENLFLGSVFSATFDCI